MARTVIDVGEGGTGASTLTAHGVIIGEGTSAVAVTSAGSTGQVLTSNGSSADPTFQNLPSWTPRILADCPLTYVSSSSITVGSGYAIDSLNSTNMTLASATTISPSSTGLGGMDVSATQSGTVSTSALSATVTGTSTTFFTSFGTRAGSGTITVAGTNLTGGSNNFLTQVAVGDLIGNSTIGYAQVIAITSATTLVLASSLTGSAVSYNIIEQPTFQAAAQTIRRVVAIASQTTLTLNTNSSATNASNTYRVGGLFAGDGSNNSYVICFLCVSSGTTGVILSHQRTTPYTSTTAYRAIGSLMLDTSSNVINFSQRGHERERVVFLEVAESANKTELLAAASSTAGSSQSANACTPPSATDLYLTALFISHSGGNSASFSTRGGLAVAGAAGSKIFVCGNVAATDSTSTFWLHCDPCQYFNYATVASTDSLYVWLAGWKETW